MTTISLFEIIVLGVPQVILLFFGLQIFSGYSMETRPKAISILILTVTTVGIRMLPLDYGVHIVLNVLVLIFVSVWLCKVQLLKAIMASIYCTLLLFAMEALSIGILQFIYGPKLLEVLNDSYKKTLLGFPALVLFGISLYVVNKILARKRLKLNDSNEVHNKGKL